jgi:hypothetical protein
LAEGLDHGDFEVRETDACLFFHANEFIGFICNNINIFRIKKNGGTEK